MPTYETPGFDVTLDGGEISKPFVDPTYAYVHPPNTDFFGATDTDFYGLGDLAKGTSRTLYVGGAIDEQIQAAVSSLTFTEDSDIATGNTPSPDHERDIALYPTGPSGNGDFIKVDFTAFVSGAHHIGIADIGGGSDAGFVDAPAPYVITADSGLAADFTSQVRSGSDPVPEPDRESPVALDDRTVIIGSGAQTIDVLANDTDPNGDSLEISAVLDAPNGAVRLAEAGGIIYTPDRGFRGADGFEYTVSDGNGNTDTGGVDVIVTGGPQPSGRMGFLPDDAMLDDAMDFDALNVTAARIFSADQRAFLGLDLSGTTDSGFVPVNSLNQLPAEAGKYFFKTFSRDQGTSDWQQFRVAESSAGQSSLVSVIDQTLPSDTSIAFDKIIDASGLDASGRVRVLFDGNDFGFLTAAQLADETFTTPSGDGSVNLWLDTFLSGNGRSGWARTEIEHTPEDTIETVGTVSGALAFDGDLLMG